MKTRSTLLINAHLEEYLHTNYVKVPHIYMCAYALDSLLSAVSLVSNETYISGANVKTMIIKFIV